MHYLLIATAQSRPSEHRLMGKSLKMEEKFGRDMVLRSKYEPAGTAIHINEHSKVINSMVWKLTCSGYAYHLERHQTPPDLQKKPQKQ
jgi:hypothetical protein